MNAANRDYSGLTGGKKEVCGPLIGKDDLYTQWSMMVMKEKHVIEVCGWNATPHTS